jgi:hypothetical protein
MPAPADIPPEQLLQVITQAVRLLEANVLPERLQDALHSWTLHAIRAFRQQIEAQRSRRRAPGPARAPSW